MEKRKHETSINQLVKLKEKIFPNQSFQERHDNILPFISNYGIDDPVKAVIHGSAVASYTVSGFGLENLCKLDKDDLNKKINQINVILKFHKD